MPADFLQLAGKTILVFGVANKKSVAWHVAEVLRAADARVIYVVRSETRRQSVLKWLPEAAVLCCDVADPDQIEQLRENVRPLAPQIHGFVHSIAFADYSAGWLPFHETPRGAFLQAVDVSCYSFIALANALRDLIDPEYGSAVTISISTTRMAAENYGYMAPIKAAATVTSSSRR